jgi:hypothetical protein
MLLDLPLTYYPTPLVLPFAAQVCEFLRVVRGETYLSGIS